MRLLFFHFFNSTPVAVFLFFFFFNDTATTEIYTLSLHDALPIRSSSTLKRWLRQGFPMSRRDSSRPDRKSTRLNSSHMSISYAVFCLKKKKKKKITLLSKKKNKKKTKT